MKMLRSIGRLKKFDGMREKLLKEVKKHVNVSGIEVLCISFRFGVDGRMFKIPLRRGVWRSGCCRGFSFEGCQWLAPHLEVAV